MSYLQQGRRSLREAGIASLPMISKLEDVLLLICAELEVKRAAVGGARWVVLIVRARAPMLISVRGLPCGGSGT